MQALWRYPVKSMLGERLQRLEVDSRGVVGDRAYALWDPQAQRGASTKNPCRWAELLTYSARYLEEPRPGASLPPVEVHGPLAGADAPPTSLRSDDPALVMRLAERLGRSVALLDQAPAGASLDQYWPRVEGRAFQDVTNELVLPEGTFFDACPIHAISTATLAALRRPNLLIKPTAAVEDFVEERWEGGNLAIGESLELHVDGSYPRCVITTLAQGSLPESPDIQQATARDNRVTAGIRLTVVQPGPLAVGDQVRLEPR